MRERIDLTLDHPESTGLEMVDSEKDAMAPGRDASAPKATVTESAEGAKITRDGKERAFLHDVGRDLVAHLFSTSKTIRLYDLSNNASQRQLAKTIDVLQRVFDHEPDATLRASGDLVFLNECRIPVDSAHYGPFDYISEELRAREVQSVRFLPGVSQDDIGQFLAALHAVDPVADAYNELQKKLAIAGMDRIETTRLEAEAPELASPDASDIRQRSNRVYFRTVALMGEVLRTMEERHLLQVRKAKRLTQQMVDIIQTDESMFVGLASIKNFDAYTFMHSVNVCILSMLIGDRLRLTRADVARLGVSALFHDIGKTYIPSSILNSTGQLGAREWELMKYHTFFGVKELSRMRALRDAVDPMFVALQHHVHLNNNGYPQRPGGWNLRLFSRIVTVADYYDAMTASRSYQKVPITPDRALRFILEKSGEIFDPFIAKVFIQAMGLYPVGTLVELDSGEIAVVTRQHADPKYIHRPTVEVFDPAAGPEGPRTSSDLTERSAGEYRFRRSVRRTIHDSELGIDKRVFFVSQ